MDGDHFLTFTVGGKESNSFREGVLVPLRAEGIDADFVPRADGSAGPAEQQGYLNLAGAGMVRLSLALQMLLDWREGQRSRGKHVRVTLQRPGMPPLDLRTAGDDDVLLYATEGLEERPKRPPKQRPISKTPLHKRHPK